MSQQVLPQWIRTLSEALHNPKYPQVTGALIELHRAPWHYNSTDDITSSDIVGKCALGEIACHIGMSIKEVLDDESYKNNDDVHKHIMRKLGVPEDLISGKLLPEALFDEDNELMEDINDDDHYKCNLDEYIYSANDSKWPYPQIVEFIETTFAEYV